MTSRTGERHAVDVEDVRRLWAQVLTIAFVIGGGMATLVPAVGSHRSLEETRIAYYERYGFADVFARVKRAPKALIAQIAQIPGVTVTHDHALKALSAPGARRSIAISAMMLSSAVAIR